ncbi:hypothetical protein CALVIDRAFT_547112 [Calocera viscosa TUFC12733]|uniref:Uncharacterized protein n=1 Tax=Calocera viscosa (strain TUFC12733) TaxID=1330018 RepID=A0A167HUR2_CALVF|nr:hypothetical protein CALVIDRAFT_547112 [Calocera viscosa TUFC12733]
MNEDQTERVYSEFATADHMWELQSSLTAGATVGGVILSSDKTQLALFRSNSTAWPVYMSLANIHKETRRKPSQRAMVLLGYLPTTKLTDISRQEDRSARLHDLFHHCVDIMISPLRAAAQQGVDMICPDGNIRRIHPIVVSYIADHPEQCRDHNQGAEQSKEPSVGCRRNCRRGSMILAAGRRPRCRTCRRTCSKSGWVAIQRPFWADLSLCDISSSITPDLLHEIHKGLFGDHLLAWIAEIAGADDIDWRYKIMPPHDDVIHFSRGITHLDKVTGKEYKSMEKVFCVAIADLVPAKVQHTVRAFLDFVLLAQLPEHTTGTLHLMTRAWADFQASKDVFTSLKSCKGFNFAKMHKPNHHIPSIVSHGTLDGYSTELPERLHIVLAKDAFHAGNSRDYIRFMTHCRYLLWAWQQESLDTACTAMEDEDADNVRFRAEDQDDRLLGQVPFLASTKEALHHHRPKSNSMARIQHFIAKTAKWKALPSTQLSCMFSAPLFLDRLKSFLEQNYPDCTWTPSDHERFACHDHVCISLPGLPGQLDPIRLTAHCRPSPQNKARRGTSPVSRFDTVLIPTRDASYPLRGHSIGILRVIFTLPAWRDLPPLELAYVDWFENPVITSTAARLYSITKIPLADPRQGEVVRLQSIARTCHLFPMVGDTTLLSPGPDPVYMRCYKPSSLGLEGIDIVAVDVSGVVYATDCLSNPDSTRKGRIPFNCWSGSNGDHGQ